MKFINKLERRFGRYAISNLAKYIIVLYGIGMLIGTFYPSMYFYMVLDFDKVFSGQIWRLVTFIVPVSSLGNIFYVFFKAYLFYIIGNYLENAWGSFRFNLYFFSGLILDIIVSLLIYLVFHTNIMLLSGYILESPLDLIYTSMFFAFAALYPNMQFLIYFIIPVKVKYLAWISAAYYGYIIYNLIKSGYTMGIIVIAVSLLNFVIFFFATRNYQRYSPREFERKARYRRQMNEAKHEGNVVQFNGRNVITRHKCAVCGRTELDGDNLEFRFCSKCDGNYEYCMDHLFTHEHVKK